MTNLWALSGVCCGKITKNSLKSTFLESFDLIVTGNLFGPPPEADLGPMISPPFVRPFVRSSVRPAIFLKTTRSIFLIFCTDLYNNETKKVTFLFFLKKILIPRLRGLASKNELNLTVSSIFS